MIKKERIYTCIKKFTEEIAGKKVTFFKECKYTAPKDGVLLWFDNIASESGAVEVTITPDVADRCFREEMVNHPAHYQGSIECIDVVRYMPFWKGNAIKYLWRAGIKQEVGKSDVDKEIEDLEKAIWYINDRINQLKQIQ